MNPLFGLLSRLGAFGGATGQQGGPQTGQQQGGLGMLNSNWQNILQNLMMFNPQNAQQQPPGIPTPIASPNLMGPPTNFYFDNPRLGSWFPGATLGGAPPVNPAAVNPAAAGAMPTELGGSAALPAGYVPPVIPSLLGNKVK